MQFTTQTKVFSPVKQEQEEWVLGSIQEEIHNSGLAPSVLAVHFCHQISALPQPRSPLVSNVQRQPEESQGFRISEQGQIWKKLSCCTIEKHNKQRGTSYVTLAICKNKCFDTCWLHQVKSYQPWLTFLEKANLSCGLTDMKNWELFWSRPQLSIPRVPAASNPMYGSSLLNVGP